MRWFFHDPKNPESGAKNCVNANAGIKAAPIRSTYKLGIMRLLKSDHAAAPPNPKAIITQNKTTNTSNIDSESKQAVNIF